jgi:hypothetical protein
MVRAFFSGKDAARFVLAKVGLSDLYTVDARRYLEARGGRIETKAQVVGIGVRDREVTHLDLRDGRRLTASAYVSAIPPQGLFPLLPISLRREVPMLGAMDRLKSSPIISVHVWFDRPLVTPEFAGFVGTQTLDRDKITGRKRRVAASHVQTSGARRGPATTRSSPRPWPTRRAAGRGAGRRAPGAGRKEKFATMSPTVELRLRPPT